MASKNIATNDATLGFETPVTGNVDFTLPSTKKAKALGQSVHADGDQFTVQAGATNGTCTTTAPYVDSMPTTASKTKAEGALVLRVDDSKTVNIPGVLSGGGACTLTATVKITDAGQSKVKGT